MDRTDVDELLRSIDTVECCFPDTWGILVGRRMPVGAFLKASERGLSMPNAPLAWNVRGDIEPTPYASADTGFPNMHVMPDLSTLRRAGWADRTAICLMNTFLQQSGPPNPLDSRAILRRAEERLAEVGYQAWVASELEFYVCTPDGHPLYEDRRAWSMTRGAEIENMISEIRTALLGSGVPVESSQTEAGPAQMEINVAAAGPVETADNAVILRYAVKLIARRHGFRATFMPVPFESAEGSGHHLHQSLRATGSDENVFQRDEDTMRVYLGGILEHMADFTAVNLPSVNAYKRLKDYTFAPNRVSWGLDNRTVAIRIPSGDPSDRRLEIRTASSDANPYLITAGTIASGSEGISARLEPPAPTKGDAYKDDTLERLPATLGEAISRFEQSTFAKEVFGETFVETYCLVGRREESSFREHVTAWERERYFESS